MGEVQGQTAMGKEEGKSRAVGKEEVVARLVREYEGKLTILKAEHSRDIEVGAG